MVNGALALAARALDLGGERDNALIQLCNGERIQIFARQCLDEVARARSGRGFPRSPWRHGYADWETAVNAPQWMMACAADWPCPRVRRLPQGARANQLGKSNGSRGGEYGHGRDDAGDRSSRARRARNAANRAISGAVARGRRGAHRGRGRRRQSPRYTPAPGPLSAAAWAPRRCWVSRWRAASLPWAKASIRPPSGRASARWSPAGAMPTMHVTPPCAVFRNAGEHGPTRPARRCPRH